MLVYSLVEVRIRLENLSKYVFVLSYEKYAPKLQNLCDIRKQNAKKVTKGSKNSPFYGHCDIKSGVTIHPAILKQLV